MLGVNYNRYITKATTVKGTTNIDYNTAYEPATHYIYHTDNGVTANQGSEFTLNLISANENLQWCQAIILVDWNQDFDFADEGERIAIIGCVFRSDSATLFGQTVPL